MVHRSKRPSRCRSNGEGVRGDMNDKTGTCGGDVRVPRGGPRFSPLCSLGRVDLDTLRERQEQ